MELPIININPHKSDDDTRADTSNTNMNPGEYSNDNNSGRITPPNIVALEAGTTPIQAQSINSQGSELGSLHTRWEKLVSDSGPVLEYSINCIIDWVLPEFCYNTYNLPSKKENLIDANLYINNNTWTAFEGTPANSHLSEDNYFAPMSKLYANVVNLFFICPHLCSQKPLAIVPSVTLVTKPNMVPGSDHRNQCHPDIQVLLNNKHSIQNLADKSPITKNNYLDIICIREVKKRNSKADRYDVSVHLFITSILLMLVTNILCVIRIEWRFFIVEPS